MLLSVNQLFFGNSFFRKTDNFLYLGRGSERAFNHEGLGWFDEVCNAHVFSTMEYTSCAFADQFHLIRFSVNDVLTK